MRNLCVNNSQELVMINTGKLAYVVVDGNYVRVQYIGGMKVTLTISLKKMQELLLHSIGPDQKCPFIRLGRSLIINQSFLCGISVPKQQLLLGDYGTHIYALKLPKELLRTYKEQLEKI